MSKIHTFRAESGPKVVSKGLAAPGTKQEFNTWKLYDDGVHVIQVKVSFITE